LQSFKGIEMSIEEPISALSDSKLVDLDVIRKNALSALLKNLGVLEDALAPVMNRAPFINSPADIGMPDGDKPNDKEEQPTSQLVAQAREHLNQIEHISNCIDSIRASLTIS
jgi:hypothetical protein